MSSKRMLSVGDNVVDRYADQGMVFPGGGAVNVAVHARHCGWEAAYVGVLGTDEGGEFVANALIAEGVDTSGVRWTDEPNAITDIAIDAEGNRQFTSWTPVSEPIRFEDALLGADGGVDWLYTSYASGTEELLADLAVLAPVAFDFSYKDLDYAKPLLPHVTVAAFSRDAMDDDLVPEFLATLVDAGARTALVTRGARGAAILHEGELHWQDAVPTLPVDTLGAGDAFLARLLCGLHQGESVAIAAAASAALAASVCLRPGAFGRGQSMSETPKEEQ